MFLAVIGQRWLDLLNERVKSGQRDYVREEIATALDRGILVIPVLVNGAQLPDDRQLPADLRSLPLKHGQDLRHEHFGRDLAEIVAVVKSIPLRTGKKWRVIGLAAAIGAIALAAASTRFLGIRWPDSVHEKIDDRALRPGQTFRDCHDCPEMIMLPAGQYLMGSLQSESGRSSNEGPQHKVQIAKPFAVGKYEITVEEYEAFVSAAGEPADGGGCNVWTAYGHRFEKDRSFRTPSFSQTPQHPVVCVSWQAATIYTNWLTAQTGKKYRLLSEAEWEYAARANTTTRYFFGDDEAALCLYANGADRTSAFLWGNYLCSDGVGVQTATVGSYRPNPFGLYDMLGNAWEWVQDCTHETYAGAPADGSPWMTGACQERVIRGGAWDNDAKMLRSAARSGYKLQPKDTIGFRVARDLE